MSDIFRGIRDVGNWQSFNWGSRWEINGNEVERALSKIDIERNKIAAMGGAITAICGFASAGLAVPAVGGITATAVASFEILKSRIKSENKGNGVIIDFPLDYSAKVKSLGGHATAGLTANICNVRPR